MDKKKRKLNLALFERAFPQDEEIRSILEEMILHEHNTNQNNLI